MKFKGLLIVILLILTQAANSEEEEGFAQDWIIGSPRDVAAMFGFFSFFNIVGSTAPAEYGDFLILTSPIMGFQAAAVSENKYVGISSLIFQASWGHFTSRMDKENSSYEDRLEDNTLALIFLLGTTAAIHNLTSSLLPEKVSITPSVVQNDIRLNLAYQF